jgi:hypothetical protein
MIAKPQRGVLSEGLGVGGKKVRMEFEVIIWIVWGFLPVSVITVYPEYALWYNMGVSYDPSTHLNSINQEHS